MTNHRKPFSIGRLNEVFRLATGISAWSYIMRHFTMKNPNSTPQNLIKIRESLESLELGLPNATKINSIYIKLTGMRNHNISLAQKIHTSKVALLAWKKQID